jgi:hypothetical protein
VESLTAKGKRKWQKLESYRNKRESHNQLTSPPSTGTIKEITPYHIKVRRTLNWETMKIPQSCLKNTCNCWSAKIMFEVLFVCFCLWERAPYVAHAVFKRVSPAWPETCDPPISASWVLESQTCPTTPLLGK